LEWNELLSRISTKGDLATVLLCGTAGFVGDVALSLTGLFSPGVVAGLAASAGLGVKSGVDGFLEHRQNRNDSSQGIEKAGKVITLLMGAGFAEDANRLERELTLARNGLSDLNTLSRVTEECLEHWRKAGSVGMRAAGQ
jgi:hypothetical protein